ncbi:MAG: DoxX [Solirubrobacteraceae bacterium]|nr:DoxX [Solirubrobacteraceae bacterium]
MTEKLGPHVPSRTPLGLPAACAAFGVGLVFVVSGADKLLEHATAAAHFASWAFPLPGVTVVVAGALELAGGLLLMGGLAVRGSALVLAVEMGVVWVLAGAHAGHEQLVVPLALALTCGALAHAAARAERQASVDVGRL